MDEFLSGLSPQTLAAVSVFLDNLSSENTGMEQRRLIYLAGLVYEAGQELTDEMSELYDREREVQSYPHQAPAAVHEELCPLCQSPLDGTDLSCVNSGCSGYGENQEARLVWESYGSGPDEIQNGTAVWNQ